MIMNWLLADKRDLTIKLENLNKEWELHTCKEVLSLKSVNVILECQET